MEENTNFNLKPLLIFIIIVEVIILGMCGCSSSKDAQLEAYKDYQRATETLLDSIENTYNWLDTVGESDVYVDWCETRKKLK